MSKIKAYYCGIIGHGWETGEAIAYVAARNAREAWKLGLKIRYEEIGTDNWSDGYREDYRVRRVPELDGHFAGYGRFIDLYHLEIGDKEWEVLKSLRLVTVAPEHSDHDWICYAVPQPPSEDADNG